MRQPPGRSTVSGVNWEIERRACLVCCVAGRLPVPAAPLHRFWIFAHHQPYAHPKHTHNPTVRWRRKAAGRSWSRSLLLALLVFCFLPATTVVGFGLAPLLPRPGSRLPPPLAPRTLGLRMAAPTDSSAAQQHEHMLRKRRIRFSLPSLGRSPVSDVRGGGGGDGDGKGQGQLLPSLRGATANEHDADIWRLSGPALLTLVVDPALSIVDTAYVGRCACV